MIPDGVARITSITDFFQKSVAVNLSDVSLVVAPGMGSFDQEIFL